MLGALAALAENSNLISNTCMGWLMTSCDPSSRDSVTLFRFLQAPTHMCADKHVFKIKKQAFIFLSIVVRYSIHKMTILNILFL